MSVPGAAKSSVLPITPTDIARSVVLLELAAMVKPWGLFGGPCHRFISILLLTFLLLPTTVLGRVSQNPDGNGYTSSGETDTIIDVLSSRTEFSILLHHLQRTGLIPLINRSRGATLLAPVNSAFFRAFGGPVDSHGVEVDADTLASIYDTKITKDMLMYHLLNATVLTRHFEDHPKRVYDTYLSDKDHSMTGRMPVVAEKHNNNDKSEPIIILNHISKIVEPDLKAGIGRGVVMGVDELLTIPDHLCVVLEREVHSNCTDYSIGYFNSLVRQQIDCKHEMVPKPITSLVLTDHAFECFNDIEKTYLLTQHAQNDRDNILFRHVIPELVGMSSSRNDFTYLTLDQTPLTIEPTNFTINNTWTPLKTDIVASNGIMHVYNAMLVPDTGDQQLVTFNPQKYLWGLGADNFVDEVALRKITHYIDGSTTTPQTIFVTLTNTDMPPFVQYHFVEEEVDLTPYQRDGFRYAGVEFLLTTNLRPYSMKPYPQRLKARVSEKGHVYVNSQRVVSSRIKVGNTSIYLLDNNVLPPGSLYAALGPFFQSSYSMEFLSKLDLLGPFSGPPRTYLVPSRQAWESQHLLMDYLSQNVTALSSYFNSLVLDKPVYSDSEWVNARSLDGNKAKVHVECHKAPYTGSKPKSAGKETVLKDPTRHHEPPLHCFACDISVNGVRYDIQRLDVLFDKGVAHVIDKVHIPDTVEISAKDLIKAGGRSQFLDLMETRNFTKFIDGSSFSGENLNFTILVPNMESLDKDGYTQSDKEIDFLLSMHILEGNPIDDLVAGKEIETVADNIRLTGRKVGQDSLLIQLVNGQGHEVYVSKRGDTTDGTTILFLDKYISPKWIPILQRPRFQLKTHVAILIGVACGVIGVSVLIALGVYAFVRRDSRYKVVEENDIRDDHESTRPLLGSRQHTANSSRSHGSVSPNLPSSPNPGTSPIPTVRVQNQREFGQTLNLPPN